MSKKHRKLSLILIGFLLILLTIMSFATPLEAPNQLIIENPYKEVKTVEANKNREHAEMNIFVNKLNPKNIKGYKIDDNEYYVELPSEDILKENEVYYISKSIEELPDIYSINGKKTIVNLNKFKNYSIETEEFTYGFIENIILISKAPIGIKNFTISKLDKTSGEIKKVYNVDRYNNIKILELQGKVINKNSQIVFKLNDEILNDFLENQVEIKIGKNFNEILKNENTKIRAKNNNLFYKIDKEKKQLLVENMEKTDEIKIVISNSNKINKIYKGVIRNSLKGEVTYDIRSSLINYEIVGDVVPVQPQLHVYATFTGDIPVGIELTKVTLEGDEIAIPIEVPIINGTGEGEITLDGSTFKLGYKEGKFKLGVVSLNDPEMPTKIITTKGYSGNTQVNEELVHIYKRPNGNISTVQVSLGDAKTKLAFLNTLKGEISHINTNNFGEFNVKSTGDDWTWFCFYQFAKDMLVADKPTMELEDYSRFDSGKMTVNGTITDAKDYIYSNANISIGFEENQYKSQYLYFKMNNWNGEEFNKIFRVHNNNTGVTKIRFVDFNFHVPALNLNGDIEISLDNTTSNYSKIYNEDGVEQNPTVPETKVIFTGDIPSGRNISKIILQIEGISSSVEIPIVNGTGEGEIQVEDSILKIGFENKGFKLTVVKRGNIPLKKKIVMKEYITGNVRAIGTHNISINKTGFEILPDKGKMDFGDFIPGDTKKTESLIEFKNPNGAKINVTLNPVNIEKMFKVDAQITPNTTIPLSNLQITNLQNGANNTNNFKISGVATTTIDTIPGKYKGELEVIITIIP